MGLIRVSLILLFFPFSPFTDAAPVGGTSATIPAGNQTSSPPFGQSSPIPCSVDTCGATCGVASESSDSSNGNSIGTIENLSKFQERALPNPGDPTNWVRQLSAGLPAQNWVPVPRTRGTTSISVSILPNQHSAAGVIGLYGCTSVIIVSKEGIYISHILENPTFIQDDSRTPTDDQTFWDQSYNMLENGNPYEPRNSVALKKLIGRNGILRKSALPTIFIITPFTTSWDEDYLGITTILRYDARINRLRQALPQLVPGSRMPDVFGYRRTDKATSEDRSGFYGRAIVEWDTRDGLTWRLWVEDRQVAEFDGMLQVYQNPTAGN